MFTVAEYAPWAGARPNHAGNARRRWDVELVTDVSNAPTAAPDTAEAFAIWVRPHVAVMTRLAARLAPSAEQDDIVQEALVRAWQKRAQYDPRRGTASSWLLAITADRARRVTRRRRPVAELRDAPIRIRSTDEAVDVEFAVARLSTRQRLAVDCFYFVGLSVAETAAVMQCSEGTVKSTLSDARRRLRPMLEVRDG
jgi:RNA polymerase sigma factor (sigma-70 family)